MEVGNRKMATQSYKTIQLKNGIYFQCYRDTISWDIYGLGIQMDNLFVEKLFQLFFELPEGAFKLGKARCNLFSFGRDGYSFIRLNKEYLKENFEELTNRLKTLLETIPPCPFTTEEMLKKSIRGVDVEEKLGSIWEVFRDKYEELRQRYIHWEKKKQENKHYNRFRILERDGFKCKLCGRGAPEVELHIDHWIPKARGGLDIYENLVTLCSQCNISKHAQIPKNKIEEIINNGN